MRHLPSLVPLPTSSLRRRPWRKRYHPRRCNSALHQLLQPTPLPPLPSSLLRRFWRKRHHTLLLHLFPKWCSLPYRDSLCLLSNNRLPSFLHCQQSCPTPSPLVMMLLHQTLIRRHRRLTALTSTLTREAQDRHNQRQWSTPQRPRSRVTSLSRGYSCLRRRMHYPFCRRSRELWPASLLHQDLNPLKMPLLLLPRMRFQLHPSWVFTLTPAHLAPLYVRLELGRGLILNQTLTAPRNPATLFLPLRLLLPISAQSPAVLHPRTWTSLSARLASNSQLRAYTSIHALTLL
jgi:hypothetical protein